MNNWDKVEKKKRAATQADVNWEYVKMVMWLVAGYLYFHFVVMGWHFG